MELETYKKLSKEIGERTVKDWSFEGIDPMAGSILWGTDGAAMYATPFWEGHEGLPIEFHHKNGEVYITSVPLEETENTKELVDNYLDAMSNIFDKISNEEYLNWEKL